MSDLTVLVVDDEPAVADGQAARLSDEYAVTTAYDGRAALETAATAEPEVVLLDRRMPGMSGDAVLRELRRGPLDPRVAMLTGVEPDGDILAMPFDDYLVKPVAGDDLLATVEGLAARATYDEQLQEYFSLASKIAVLETEHDDETLAELSEYDELQSELTELKATLDDRLDDLGTEGFGVAIDDELLAQS
ncbi:MAG: HalX domain-containing protein [Halolamina sp.]